MSKVINKEFWAEFLELYKSLPALWMVKSADYSNRILKNFAYEEMIKKLKEIDENANRDMVVRKINTFRSNYRRDLKKINQSKKSGASAEDIFESSLWYFDILSFLEEQEGVLEGRSTIEDTETRNCDVAPKNDGPARKKTKITDEDHLIKLACEHLKENSNDGISKGWASQYAEMTNYQKIFARKIISDVLFHGCLGHLNEHMTREIQNVLVHSEERTSTPLWSESNSSSCNSSSCNVLREEKS